MMNTSGQPCRNSWHGDFRDGSWASRLWRPGRFGRSCLVLAVISLIVVGDSTATRGQERSEAERLRVERIGAERVPRDVTPSPKVLRYCQRVLEQLGAEDRRGLPLELWPNGPSAAEPWDVDGDGYLSAREMATQVQEYARSRSLRVLAAPAAAQARSAIAPAQSGEGLHGDVATREAPAGERPSQEEAVSGSSGSSREAGVSPSDAIYQVSPSRLAAGVPPWFAERDKDGDGQLTLSEFAPEPTGQSIEEFRRLDWNNDGVITLEEARRGPRSADSTP